MSKTKPTREEVERWLSEQRTRLDAAVANGVSLEVANRLWSSSIAYRIARAYLAQLDEVKRLEAERDALLKKDYEETDHEMWREVDRLRAENEKLRALVGAARESAQGEVGWSKFDRLLAEWDEEERG